MSAINIRTNSPIKSTKNTKQSRSDPTSSFYTKSNICCLCLGKVTKTKPADKYLCGHRVHKECNEDEMSLVMKKSNQGYNRPMKRDINRCPICSKIELPLLRRNTK